MPLIRRVWESLSFENMAQVTSAVGTSNFNSLHEHRVVFITLNSTRNRIKIGRPSTATAKLVRSLVQWGIATSASVDPLSGVMLVVLASTRPLCAFLAEDTKLLW